MDRTLRQRPFKSRLTGEWERATWPCHCSLASARLSDASRHALTAQWGTDTWPSPLTQRQAPRAFPMRA